MVAVPAGLAASADPSTPGMTDRHARGVEPAIVDLSVTPRTIWPAPEDRGDQATVAFTITAPGDYELYVSDHGGSVADHDFGHLDSGTYSWTWNGKNAYEGGYARETKHFVYVYGWRDDGLETGTEKSVPVVVKRGTDEIWVADRYRERGSRSVDIDVFTLQNGPKSATVIFDFYGRTRPARTSVIAQLDVSKLKKGYLVTRSPDRTGRMRLTLWLANLASDVGRPHKIRCPGLATKATAKRLSVTIPRTCMKGGGHKMRANYTVYAADHPDHYDYGPEGKSYWTKWAAYEVAPRRA